VSIDCADCTQCCSHSFDDAGASWHGIGDSAAMGAFGIADDGMLHAYADTASWSNSNADNVAHPMNLRCAAFIRS
jgi:hypothetical protein